MYNNPDTVVCCVKGGMWNGMEWNIIMKQQIKRKHRQPRYSGHWAPSNPDTVSDTVVSNPDTMAPSNPWSATHHTVVIDLTHSCSYFLERHPLRLVPLVLASLQIFAWEVQLFHLCPSAGSTCTNTYQFLVW